MTDQAFVTLATNDAYGKGALVLGMSLRNHRTSRKLVIMVSPQVSLPMRAVLQKIFDEVRLVDVLDSEDSAHLALMQRPELGVTLTKLHCWTLTHYSKCVFMDADTMVLSNIDDLFEREELSAAPDPGWPDCFNSGLFVFRPSNETYNKLLQFSAENGSFDGGDQGILNSFFSNWATTDIQKHLPFIYNLSSVAIYSYLPAFKQYGAETKVVHFLGRVKPWNCRYDSKTKSVTGDSQDLSMLHPEFLNMWWDIFSMSMQPLLAEHGVVSHSEPGCQSLSSLVSTLALSCGISSEDEATEAVSRIHVGAPPPSPPPPMSSAERKQKWEQGQADYMGADSFDNIQKKLDAYLK
ncbi:glycogenin-1-like isoform X1 [Polyodon spathula]|uniref:glycogenin-1-like isoform X1 n=1 Tax=Polyodon spathula TaxID=7913 RepID=UPI001B7E13A7|nr:glycogenin-1-like isoform X1 [Polyodon spathula]